MFERFTDRARRAVVLAQEEARAFDHDYIGTEHILLGLMHQEDGVAAQALDALGLELERARAQLDEIVGRGRATPSGHIPFTPRAKKVLELALREALQLGHNYIGTEHVLLGLIREGEGVGAQMLVGLGISLDRARAEVMAQLGGREPHHGQLRRLFGRRRGPEVDPFAESEESSEPSPLEQFDDAAWDALGAARQAARRRAGVVVDTPDLLLGVASVPGPGSDALHAVGLDADALRPSEAEPEPQRSEPPAALSYSDAARDALHRAVEESQRRGHAAAGTGHLLQALLLRPDDRLEKVLGATGVARGDLHAETARRIA